MRPFTLVLAACVLGACTPMKWVKPDATPEQSREDAQQCEQDAWREARAHYWYYQPAAPTVTQDAAGRPIVISPSGGFSSQSVDPALEAGRLAQRCMREKGYQLAPADTIQPSASGTATGKPKPD